VITYKNAGDEASGTSALNCAKEYPKPSIQAGFWVDRILNKYQITFWPVLNSIKRPTHTLYNYT